jgi:hypothetical protein
MASWLGKHMKAGQSCQELDLRFFIVLFASRQDLLQCDRFDLLDFFRRECELFGL